LIQGDATRPEVVHESVGQVDIVIDDGSHVIDEQLTAFRLLERKLAPGGLYVIEDIWPHENALRLQREIPGSEVIDRRHVKGRPDDIMLVYRRPHEVAAQS
jgi:hypothetical protein